jgi:hypothetical protein
MQFLRNDFLFLPITKWDKTQCYCLMINKMLNDSNDISDKHLAKTPTKLIVER